MSLAPVNSYIKGQRMQWLDRILRRSEEESIRAKSWNENKFVSKGKRSGNKPRKRWLHVVEEDPKAMVVQELKKIVQDRDERRRDIVTAAKTLIPSCKCQWKRRIPQRMWCKYKFDSYYVIFRCSNKKKLI